MIAKREASAIVAVPVAAAFAAFGLAFAGHHGAGLQHVGRWKFFGLGGHAAPCHELKTTRSAGGDGSVVATALGAATA